MTLPSSHIEDAHKLQADAVVELFELTLSDNSKVYLKADNDVDWQGNTYEGTLIQITDVSQTSDDENGRPKMVLGNPEGIFSPLIRDGSMDRALVTRIRVLRPHLLANQNISQRQSWRVMRIVTVNRKQITVDLRDQLDGQFFQIPGRLYIPPDFPQVSLS